MHILFASPNPLKTQFCFFMKKIQGTLEQTCKCFCIIATYSWHPAHRSALRPQKFFRIDWLENVIVSKGSIPLRFFFAWVSDFSRNYTYVHSDAGQSVKIPTLRSLIMSFYLELWLPVITNNLDVRIHNVFLITFMYMYEHTCMHACAYRLHSFQIK
jgi:hypothetical protein